jgi:hypothetical protein
MQLKKLSVLFDVTSCVRCYPFLRYRIDHTISFAIIILERPRNWYGIGNAVPVPRKSYIIFGILCTERGNRVGTIIA